MAQSKMAEVLQLAHSAGVIRTRDLQERGIPRVYLQRLCDRGLIVRSGRGIYTPVDFDVTEYHTLVEACQRVPSAVVCLLSALRFHGMTTQNPYQVWIAIHTRARRPRADLPPLHIFRFSGTAWTDGIEEHIIEGLPVRVYNPAKTVADCFKYRNKIGLDVAVEALRDCWKKRLSTVRELRRFARVCRVTSVMQPYLEMLE